MFYAATEAETIRPMLDVAWAPMLGAFSVVFEQFHTGSSKSMTGLVQHASPSSCRLVSSKC